MKRKSQKMTFKDIKEAVQDIELMKGDPESAHVLEDKLYLEAIKFVCKGGNLTPQMALKILETQSIDFERWCG